MWFKILIQTRKIIVKTNFPSLGNTGICHPHQTKQLQAWLSERLGGEEYFGGAYGFGWADVCVAPILNRSFIYGLGPEQGSPLARWHERISQRPSVQKTFDEYEAGVTNTAGYVDVLKKGLIKREYRDHRLEWMVKSGGIDVVVEGLKNKNIRFSWPDPLE